MRRSASIGANLGRRFWTTLNHRSRNGASFRRVCKRLTVCECLTRKCEIPVKHLRWDKRCRLTQFCRFVGGELNACYNAVDRHVRAGKGNKTALIHDSPQTSTIRRVTYNELLEKTSLLAGALADMGVRKGDMVIIYMPLIPETIIAILATTRLGAVHSVVFGGKISLRVDFCNYFL